MIKTEVQGIYKKSEGVLINKDDDALASYKKQKMRNKRIEKMEEDMTSLKSDIEEIKNLLRGLVK
jgi:peptidoglycan hydrolase CwlO-like protein